MDMDDAIDLFIIEAHELLEIMEETLLGLDSCEEINESVGELFRSAHTIKGSAGLFGLEEIVGFTHILENVMDRLRSKEIGLSETLINLMLSCKDHLVKLINSIEQGKVIIGPDEQARDVELKKALEAYLDISPQEQEVENTGDQLSGSSDYTITTVNEHEMIVDNGNWHISVHFGNDVLRNGMDPLSFLNYLEKIGEIENIVTLSKGLPDDNSYDPESCYLGFEINYHTDAGKETIEDVFEFVKEDCQLSIIPPHGKASEFIQVIDSLANEDLKLGEILVRCGTLTQRELSEILKIQESETANPSERKLLGEIVAEQKLADPDVVEAALNKQSEIKNSKEKIKQTIRVDSSKLENLINLIGELVIAGAGMESEISNQGITSLRETSLIMKGLIEDVRDSALNLRMVHIGDTFNRFQRVVRDVSKELGKDINLEISGADTELDKTVVEKIGDPLMHLVRNSIDHGIESYEVRERRGKQKEGKLSLNAYHESGSIVIEVADDGGGLNKEKILSKAIEKGIVDKDAELSDQEINQLIFSAGFSTADQVSNLSGRGVGMDVVRQNIEALRGTIELDSIPEVGTTTRIRLPLTLAIIDGFMMSVGSANFVVPLDIVEECIELGTSDKALDIEKSYMNLRGEALPFIRLREYFNERGEGDKRENIVVVKHGSKKAGFVVDRLLGEFQTVIKPLGPLFDNLSGVSGSTILGSGDVALILDAPSLIEYAMQMDGGGRHYDKKVSNY